MEINQDKLPAPLPGLAADEFARLSAALQSHCQRDAEAPLLEAIVFTVIRACEGLAAELPAEALAALCETDWPEARVCYFWSSRGEPGAVEEMVALAREPLWPPAQAMAYRALADIGRRSTLATLLPQSGPLTLHQAEAWLEAAQLDGDEDWTGRIALAPNDPLDGLLPAELSQQWRALIVAEAGLARGAAVDERAFESLIASVDEQPARGYAEAERKRLAARAAALLARVRLAEWRAIGELLNTPAGRLLPEWEREYLQALARWQFDDQAAAVAGLQRALALNAGQTPIRLALATLLAEQAPEQACQLLNHAEPTREMLAAQAALFARLGRYQEAEAALQRCEGEPASRGEAARYSWLRGREQARRREQTLRAALAERRGDWTAAERAHSAALSDERQKSLREARQLFAAQQELRTLAPGQRWRRNLLEQRLDRGWRQLTGVPLLGDALFFRAIAICDSQPERATKDLQTLLGRRAWIEAERSAGGGRIVCIGDALLRLGQFNDAIRAYRLAGESLPGVKERLAVASIRAEIWGRRDAAAISAAAEHATDNNPLLQGLAALGLSLAGDAAAATARAAAIEGDDPVTRALRAALQTMTGASATLTDADFAALNLLPETETLLRWLCCEGTEPDKLKALARRFGDEWIKHCPANAELAARCLLAARCDAGEWEQAIEFARTLERSGEPWAIDLAALARARRAMELAIRGDLDAAERELNEMETILRR